MSTVTVMVHLDADRGEPAQTCATRVSRKGWAGQWLRGHDDASGCWDGGDAADAAAAIARRHGLDPDAEQPRAREVDTAFADERSDPRWIVTFDIADR